MTDYELIENKKQVSIKFDGLTKSKCRDIFKGLSGSTKFEGNYNNYDFKAIPVKQTDKKANAVSKVDKSEFKKVNKSKLKAKIHSFFRLSQSQKFCAFYSVSFPLNMPDLSAQKVLNNVLTSLRLNSVKFQYVWVSERQKNGTIHFHILINRWLNIKITNLLFARAISNEINVSKLHHLEYNPSQYNGVDVKRVMSEKGINNYVTKYVTKNDEQFKGRAWSSCQVVSRLFTSVSYMYGEVFMNDVHFYYNDLGKLIYFDNDYFTNWPLKYPPPRHYMKPLIIANNLIARKMETGKKKMSKMSDKEKSKYIASTKVKHVQLEITEWESTNIVKHIK